MSIGSVWDERNTQQQNLFIDAGRNALEQGDAVPADGLWWEYTTTATVADPAAAQVTAIAYDLPGNDHTLVWENN